jgi:hypothetical protein
VKVLASAIGDALKDEAVPVGVVTGIEQSESVVTCLYLPAAAAAFFFSACTVQGGTMPFCRA